MDERELPADFVEGVRRYKYRGSSGKVNLALDALPNFTCMPGPGPHLRGAISISPSVDYMEQAYDDAKYGQFSRRPYMDMVIPSLTDPSVAPPGKHVMSCFVQYAPYHLKDGVWDDRQREAFGDAVINTIAEYAPNIKDIILHRQVLTPLDIERDFGLTEGNIFQGELTLEQLFFLRPVPGWAQYATPIDRLYMCGSATHPGGGIMGAPGTQRRRAHPQRCRDDPSTRSGKPRYDAIVIGGGVNGLTCATAAGEERRPHAAARAARRARRLRQPKARSRRASACRCWRTRPGRCGATWSKSCSCICTASSFSDSPIHVSTLSPDGRPLVVYERCARRPRRACAPGRAKDAARWPAVPGARLQRLGALIGSLFMHTPPSVDAPSARDVFSLMHTLGDFRVAAEGRSVAAAAMGADGGRGSGRRIDRHRAAARHGRRRRHLRRDARSVVGRQRIAAAAGDGQSIAGVAGGPPGRRRTGGARARRSPPRRSRFGVDDPHRRAGRRGSRSRTNARRRHARRRRDASRRARVVSGVDPKRTFLTLCDADHLPPEFLWRMKHYRSRGTLAKVNLALSALPSFTGATREMLAGRVRLAPDLDYLERAFDHAKYGRFSTAAVDRVHDSVARRSDAGAAWRARAVGVRAVRAVHASRGRLGCVARCAGRHRRSRRCRNTRRASRSLIVERQVLTPLDLERGWGLTGGQIFHGELSLDQFFTMRPLLGFGQYRTPIKGLFLCGSGAHPGTGLTGGSGMNAAREIATGALSVARPRPCSRRLIWRLIFRRFVMRT